MNNCFIFKRIYSLSFIIIWSVLGGQGCTLENSSTIDKILIDSTIVPESKYEMELKLVNKSKQVIRFSAHFFHTSLLKIRAVGSESKKDLFQIKELGGHGEITVMPGYDYKRTLKLNYLFPDLVEKASKQNIVITWNTKVEVTLPDGSTSLVYSDGKEIIKKPINNE